MTPLVDAGLVRGDWSTRLPNGASPASSVIAVIVRAGNPRKIRSWEDIAAPGIEVVAINPKTSGNARWGVLAGYGALVRERDQKAGEAWVTALVRNTRTLASGGREATDAFVKNGVGDVLLTFENEALFVAKASAAPIEFVVPPVNVRTDFPVVVVDRVVDRCAARAPSPRRSRGSSSVRGPRPSTRRRATVRWTQGAQGRRREVRRRAEAVLDRRSRRLVQGGLRRSSPTARSTIAHRRAAVADVRGGGAGRGQSGVAPVAPRGGRPRLPRDRGRRAARGGGAPAHPDAGGRHMARRDGAGGRRGDSAIREGGAHHSGAERAARAPGRGCSAVIGSPRRFLDALVDLPLAIPGVVAGISFMSLYGPAGHIGKAAAAAFALSGALG